MNTISRTHKLFSEYLNNPRVLENPEEFLGPNFEEVLNFWLILDELSEEQLRVVKERYGAFYYENYSEYLKATDLTIEASKEAVGEDYTYHAGNAVWGVTMSDAANLVTLELIGMHLILDKQPLTFFEMFLRL